jgi:hypothetical protein
LSGKLPPTASSLEVDKLVDYLAAPRWARAWSPVASVDASSSIIPKHVLAARMGITPETLSRIFRELSDAGMIQRQWQACSP